MGSSQYAIHNNHEAILTLIEIQNPKEQGQNKTNKQKIATLKRYGTEANRKLAGNMILIYFHVRIAYRMVKTPK